MIYIGADHRGFELKQKLLAHLAAEGIAVRDLGNIHHDPEDDYVDYALKVAEQVKKDEGSKGILICGSGVGVDMVANKVSGIRSALVIDVARAIQSRQHEDINILSLPADIIDEERAHQIVMAYLTTDFSGEERHVRRLEKVKQVENSKL